jgi:hypothetical protein
MPFSSSRRFFEIDQALRKDPASVPVASIDAVVDEYDTGFRKLTWAQQKPVCVFQTAIGVTAQVPHAQAARNVARVAALKIRRELDRGEFDAALRDLARLLRLSRDLLPRGYMITALVSVAIDISVARDGILPALATASLTVTQCDQLLALLAEHEARAIDSFQEGLRAEYVSNCATLHDLVFEQQRVRAEWNRFGHTAGVSIVAEVVEPTLYFKLAANAPMPQAAAGQQPAGSADQTSSLKTLTDLDALVARTTPEELARQVQKLNELYRGLLNAANASYSEKIRRLEQRPLALTTPDIPTRVTRGIADSAFGAFAQAITRRKGIMRVSQGLVAVRRWQLRHGGAQPPSLEAAIRDAGMPMVPVDPYDDRPIRFVVVAGRPTVYCIGYDGKDDGGKVESIGAPNPGDILQRLLK